MVKDASRSSSSFLKGLGVALRTIPANENTAQLHQLIEQLQLTEYLEIEIDIDKLLATSQRDIARSFSVMISN